MAAQGLIYNPTWDPATPPPPAPMAPPMPGGGFATGGGWNQYDQGSGGFPGMGGGGFQPGSPGFQATQGAYNAQQQAANDALAKLGQNFSSSPFAQGLNNQWNKGKGFSPETMKAYQNQIGRTAAQDTIQQSRSLLNRANATGFKDSIGSTLGLQQIRAGSADRVQQSMDRVQIASEEQARQQEAQALQALVSLYGLDAGMLQAYANFQMNRQFPVIPGVSNGPSGGPSGGPQKYSSPYGAGKTPTNPWEQGQFMQQRIQEEQAQGRQMPVFMF